MQPMKKLINWFLENANSASCIFTLQDLRALYPEITNSSFKTLLSRTVQAGYLSKLCRGLYFYKLAKKQSTGLILFHAAALLRSDKFNYISLETALSDAGVISQVPINWITIMSSGCSNKISCGEFGTIEFVHTNQKPNNIMNQLSYDTQCKLWRANVPLALRDMKSTHRNCDLINWDIANEFV
jgi:hypothetical protein